MFVRNEVILSQQMDYLEKENDARQKVRSYKSFSCLVEIDSVQRYVTIGWLCWYFHGESLF